ncbi:hypothetical protein BC938DRAFT_477272 [Jimgerdemannia flammicorona]|uniref:Uncharacterized protein n=1 Tax=Jimgerdemannia flammicorona TaxID=994334 RepID=A0A433PAY0_9FUNG|nr:hypothetical protein BC938DRAFT_477272 [Jimgerdemannia flammicorona]
MSMYIISHGRLHYKRNRQRTNSASRRSVRPRDRPSHHLFIWSTSISKIGKQIFFLISCSCCAKYRYFQNRQHQSKHVMKNPFPRGIAVSRPGGSSPDRHKSACFSEVRYAHLDQVRGKLVVARKVMFVVDNTILNIA